MTGIPTPEAVEAMTGEDFAAMTAEFQSIGPAGAHPLRASWSDRIVYSLWLRCVQIEARAIPLPRRYTGGPLEDGLYLWRKPNWHPTQFVAMGVEEGVRAPHNAPKLLPDEWVWLIGPLSIPPIPESEEAK